MKICVVTPLFAIAGVPLAQLRLARALTNKGHEVDLIIGRVDPQFTLPDIKGVKVIVLNCFKVRSMLVPLIKYFINNKPEVVFTAEDHLNAIVLLSVIIVGSKVKISCSSRVTPYDTYSQKLFTKRWFIMKLMI